MTQIVIAGNFTVPDNLSLGDTLKIEGFLHVHELKQDRIDTTGYGAKEPQYHLGEVHLETVARDPLTVSKADDPIELLRHVEAH